ncbi:MULTISPECIES: PD-(D/E)XK nuclease-like domain-containing protein [unclassified Microbacterium]|uniref:PD-(D/E)XK nuclease-like domain-containing protein n=1 Tax=unclassified Microbacterium TaxID=2609290 RepID=UPI0030171F8C
MLLENLDEQSYHQRPELSSTGARRILDSPARFRYWADHPEKPKTAFDVGSAAHAKILGVGAGVILYPDEHLTPSGNVSTKAATVEWEREQRALGLIPIGRSDAHRIDRMAEAVLAEPEARAILERVTGREVTIIQEVDGVPVRARFDIFGDGEAADLKTGRDASPSGFNRSAAKWGYHIQVRWYDDAHLAETGSRLDQFPLIVVESSPPYLVAVHDLDFMYAEAAERKVAKARDLWRTCTESGVWPSYGRTTLTAPSWVVYEDENEEIQIG